MCVKAFLLTALMVVHTLEFDGDFYLRDHKKLVNEFPLTGLHEKNWVRKGD